MSLGLFARYGLTRAAAGPPPGGTLVGSGMTSYANTSSATVTFPGGITDGDLVVIFDHVDGNTNGYRFNQPTGWTRTVWSGTSARRGASYRKVYASADGASVALTSSSSGNRIVSFIVLRGVTYSTLDVTTQDTIASTAYDAPDLTFSGAGVLVTWHGVRAPSAFDEELTTPGGMDRLQYAGANGMKQVLCMEVVGSGASGVRNSSHSPDEGAGVGYSVAVLT